jgi:hypothetical protein
MRAPSMSSLASLSEILENGMSEFNQLVRDANIPAVVVKAPSP